MSADEFWKDDPQLFVSYRTSFINKKKREMEELDYKCWLQGLYNYNGNFGLFSSLKQLIHNVAMIFVKGGKKDQSKIQSYPKKPYLESAKEEKQENKSTNNNKYKNYEESLMYYGSIKQIYLKKLEQKSKESDNNGNTN